MITPDPSRIRRSLRKLKLLLKNKPLSVERRGQELVGHIGYRKLRGHVHFTEMQFGHFSVAAAEPENLRCSGIILYLHGGGYCCGGQEYAKGFGAVLANATGARVLCPAYPLAPEHRFPAALEDMLELYELLCRSFDPKKIALAGESAGGGLIYALCIAARDRGLPLPGGIAVISPWTDLTFSGSSVQKNREADPSLSLERLRFFAAAYTDTPKDPLVSPLFGELSGFPESRIFVGGDEILLDDALRLHEKLLSQGSKSRLTVAPDMWHGYLLYGMEESGQDMDDFCRFLTEVTA